MTPSLEQRLHTSLAGRYAIEREVGRGGMATVFLAHDIRHDRRVAVKVLEPELGAVLGVERFLSEIRVTANLQHPNLLPLFDSGEADGYLFYVMPYVEGGNLRAKLHSEKQLPIDEALHIAAAIASALDYAHRQGVVHRDLKPENILLHEQEPLVADFGIALALRNAGGERITQTGLSLGTPQYMSPEQATGDRVIDGRSDIYSLGAMLYEMLTGDPPHTASTTQGIIARMLTDAPRSVRSMRPHVPPHVDVAILKALEKLPADRWHNAHDFAVALGRLGDSVAIPTGVQIPGAIELAGSRPRSWRPRGIAWGMAGVVIGVAATALVARMILHGGEAQRVTFLIEPPVINGERANLGDVAVSPDGQTIAYIAYRDSMSQVYIRRLDDAESRPLSVTTRANWVSYAPDGRWLSITTFEGKMFKVATDGSSTMTVADGVAQRGPAVWAKDGSIVFGGWGSGGAGLSRLNASGAIRQLTKPAPTFNHGLPIVAPDGNTLLFEDWGPGFTEDDYLAIGSAETGEYERTSVLSSRPMGVVDGRIIYKTANGAVMAVPFDARRKRLTGEPVRVMDGMSEGFSAAEAFSRSGTLVFKRGRATNRLVLVDLNGHITPLSNDDRTFAWEWTVPRYSRDGRRVALTVRTPRGDSTSSDIWLFDVAGATFARATTLGDVASPGWTVDSRRLISATMWRSRPRVWVQDAEGGSAPEELLQEAEGVQFGAPVATADGRGLVVCQRGPRTGQSELRYVGFSGDRRPERILNDACEPSFSPDGRWLAYTSAEDGIRNVYVRPFRSSGGRTRISQDGGDSPIWSRDGRQLYYRRAENLNSVIHAARLTPRNGALEVTSRQRVAAIPSSVYDVAPDGKHILAMQESDSHVQLVVVTNWLGRLKAQLKGAR